MPAVCAIAARRLALAALFALLPGTAAAQQWADERSAGPVVIHANFSLDGYEQLVPEIVQLQQDIEQTLGVAAPQEPIHIYLFAQKSTYTNYLKRYFPTVSPRRAMFIKGRGPGMVFAYVSDQLMVDVRHETTHALLHASLPMVPLWLDEGLAEYFETPRRSRARGGAHLDKTRWAARFGRLTPVERLEAIETLEAMNEADYRHSWAVVHYALHGSEVARSELVSYLADVQAREVPGQLSARLRRRLPDFDAKVNEHFRGW